MRAQTGTGAFWAYRRSADGRWRGSEAFNGLLMGTARGIGKAQNRISQGRSFAQRVLPTLTALSMGGTTQTLSASTLT